MTQRLFPREPVQLDDEVWHLPEWLELSEQEELVAQCRRWFAPPAGATYPLMPNGQPMSVEMVCLGWHWYPYRYSRFLDNTTGEPVKPFPQILKDLGRRAVDATYGADQASLPDTGVINRYADGARMGLHQDNEERQDVPVISLSLGASCNFRFGNTQTRTKPWTDVELGSGDLFVFGGSRRRSFHGVTRVRMDGDPLTDPGERFNITIRTR